MKKTNVPSHDPTEAEIQHQAYRLWIEGGCLEGVELDNWLAAKELLRHRHGRSGGRERRVGAVGSVRVLETN